MRPFCVDFPARVFQKGMSVMSDMQAFRAQLIHVSETTDPLLKSLARLTEATASQLQILWTEPGWGNWVSDKPDLPADRHQ